MSNVILRRIASAIISVIGILTIVFFLVNVTGDAVSMMLPMGATNEEVEEFREFMGLDKPILNRYFGFVGNFFVGDFGRSYITRDLALQMVLNRLPATLLLALSALCVAVFISIPLGIISAIRQGSFVDRLCTMLVLAGQSFPTFFIGLLFILFFSVRLGIFPSGGIGSFKHLVLPSISLASFAVATIARFVRSSMVDVLNKEYIRAARAKGVSEFSLVCIHALKNAAIPVITIIGLQFGQMLTAAFVTEVVFSWPGIGRLAVTAVNGRDMPVVLASVFVSAILFISLNLLVDVMYIFLNPRVRIE